jgi:hypothetical protein
VHGKDGQPLVELLGRENESVIGAGQKARPGRLSMYAGNGQNTVNLTTANATLTLGGVGGRNRLRARQGRAAAEALLRQGLLPGAKVLDLKARLRCRGCGRKGRAVVSIRWAHTKTAGWASRCGTKRLRFMFPQRRGGTPDSAPPRRLAELVSFGLGSMRDFATPNLPSRASHADAGGKRSPRSHYKLTPKSWPTRAGG